MTMPGISVSTDGPRALFQALFTATVNAVAVFGVSLTVEQLAALNILSQSALALVFYYFPPKVQL